jgi:hypothetical protein
MPAHSRDVIDCKTGVGKKVVDERSIISGHAAKLRFFWAIHKKPAPINLLDL